MMFRLRLLVCLIVIVFCAPAVRAGCPGAAFNADGSVKKPTLVSTPTPSPTPRPGQVFYVATNGTPAGNGSIGKPWDLQTALNKTVSIPPGATVYLRGGTYVGKFVSRLTGTRATPIIVRAYPGEKFRIDGNVQSTLAAATATAAPYSDSRCVFTSNLGLPNGAAVWIENELVSITGQKADGVTWNCQRGWGGTLVAAHPAGAAAYSPDTVLTIFGSHSRFYDLEILDSYRIRVYNKNFNDTTIPIRSGGILVLNNIGTRIINPIIHDISTGVFANESAVDLEVYGAIAFNCGFVDWSRGHGQCFYLANDPAFQKRVRNSIAFNGFSNCAKAYTSSGKAANFLFEDYIAFGCGVSATVPGNRGNGGVDLPLGNRDAALFVGANGPNKATNDIKIRRAYLFEPLNSTGDPTLWTGYYEGVGSTGLELTDSRVMGGSVAFAMAFKSFSITGNKFFAQATGTASNGKLLVAARLDPGYSGVWNNNTYFDQTPNDIYPVAPFPFLFSSGGVFKLSCIGAAQLKFVDPCAGPRGGWQTPTFDVNSQYNRSPPTGTEVFVIPNDYEQGRAHIAIYNWALNETVPADLSNVLKIGDKFEVRAVEDFFGVPVASGTYAGGTIAIPMMGSAVTAPIGLGWTPPSTRPTFGVFLLRKL